MNLIKTLFLVGAGGFAGSIARYLVYQYYERNIISSFPLATITVNLAGSLLLGVLYGLASRHDWLQQEGRLLLMVGICGSFTTFSTFALESEQLFRTGLSITSIGYITASVAGCILMVFVGQWVVRSI